VSILPAASERSDFDPTAGRFCAQASRPVGWADVNPADLQPLMRVLLVVDGTVTKVLEAFFGEGIEVRRISQSAQVLAAADEWLDAERGEQIVVRSVMLVGRDTGRIYTFAESRIMLSRLSTRMQSGLDDKLLGLGRILLDAAVEVRRECLWYGRERLAALPDEMRGRCDPNFISRSYRVIARDQPLMTITERFPLNLGD
jgi:chorismate-pyruvate lyase